VDRYYWRLYATMNYPDVERKWRVPALEAGRTELRKGGYDVILSSSSPITAHIVAAELKREFGLPWVAEYRDPWSLNHNHPLGPMMRSFDGLLERRTIGQADSIVTVTEEWASDLRRMFPRIPVSCLPIGFESGDGVKVRPTDKFTITHTGQFYHGKQNPFLFLDSIARLVKEDKMDVRRLDVRFYGPPDSALQGHIEHLGLSDVVHQYGIVTREEAQARQRESQVLLMLNWEDRRQSGVSSLKLVEYFSTGRPILNSGGYRESLMAKMVEQTRTGITACTVEEIMDALMVYYAEYLCSGIVEERGNHSEISRYNFDNIAFNYARLLSTVTGPKKNT
jgi:glycosyltransferase involved in cell wall biosynthesis